MIILSLKKLEKGLGLKLKTNAICLGVDTASTTGLALISINDDKVIIETSLFKLPSIPKKIADQMKKAEKYEQAMDSALNLIRDYRKEKLNYQNPEGVPKILILEQSFLLRIGNRVINPETYGYLRSLGGIYYSELYDSFDEIKFYLATVVRKLVGFRSNLKRGTPTEEKKKEICNWISNVVKEKIESSDIADAMILSFAGLLK